jgi:hypothetical protein
VFVFTPRNIPIFYIESTDPITIFEANMSTHKSTRGNSSWRGKSPQSAIRFIKTSREQV